MAREVPEIDRLIEEGLTLYGQGDLDGALVRWEKALAIDPHNAQANSYVDYVRTNYELLTNEANGERTTSDGAPFGIAEDEPEYQIEIQPGEIRAVAPLRDAPEALDPMDEGWLIDEETHSRPGPPGIALAGRPSQELTLELEADEPPDEPLDEHSVEIEADEPPETAPAYELEPAGVSFEDATREYQPQREMTADPFGGFTPTPPPERADDFEPEGTPGFDHPTDFHTPAGFGSQATGVKQREDLGFVKPSSATDLGLPLPPRAPASPSRPPANQPRPAPPDLSLDADAPTTERPPLREQDLDDLDLISSLPSPRPAPQVPRVELDIRTKNAPASSGSTTRELPGETRAPAFSNARTRELPEPSTKPAVSATETQDFEAKTMERPGSASQSGFDAGTGVTRDIPNMAQAALTSAPTRDLGIREVAAAQAAAARSEGTRADVMLPFDPIDARSSEILDDVDETAPASETPEDKTRRRITTLFDKAAQWSSEGDLERAVAAVDLALSEDPNSALAQKLIHRNRETIMTVFQAYLGDVERTPQLARPLHELAHAPISPRAAFLLSRIDGLLTIDEILDVCGMPRLEAYRYLCQLFLRGILR